MRTKKENAEPTKPLSRTMQILLIIFAVYYTIVSCIWILNIYRSKISMFILIVRMKRDAMAAVKAIERDEMKKKWMEKQHTRCASETHIEAHRAVMALYYNRGNKHVLNRTNTHSHTITLVSQTVGDQIFFSPFPTFTPCIRPSHRIPFAQSVEMLFFSSCHQVIRHRWKVWRRRRTWRGDVLCANARKRTNAMFSFNFFVGHLELFHTLI